MTKQEFISAVAAKGEVTKECAAGIMGAMFEVITENLQKGERTSWPGFGSFETSHRKARQGRNPRTGEALQIPASKGAKFNASKPLKDSLRE